MNPRDHMKNQQDSSGTQHKMERYKRYEDALRRISDCAYETLTGEAPIDSTVEDLGKIATEAFVPERQSVTCTGFVSVTYPPSVAPERQG
jgi:hypothetical protein